MICPPNKETSSHATSHSNHRFSWRHTAEIAWKTASDAERVTQLLQARIELSDPDAFGMGYLQIAWCAWSQLQDQVANALIRLGSTGGHLLGTVFVGSAGHNHYGYSYGHYGNKTPES